MNTAIVDIYPLSPLQQGMLFHALYTPEAGLYVEHLRYSLHGDLNLAAFEQAWQEVFRRHTILRTAFIWEKLDEPHQVVLQTVTLPLTRLDWRALTPDEQQAQLAEQLNSTSQRAYDLSQAPLLDLTLIQMADDVYEFIWNYHHLLLDGWSVPLLLHELLMLYEIYCQGEESPLPDPRPYRDYIAWLRRQDQSAAEQFWRQALHDFTPPPPLELGQRTPGEHTTLAPDDAHYGVQKLRLTSATTEKLQAFARQHRLTLNTVVQGAWAVLLSRYSGQPDVCFGAVVSGRPTDLPGADMMVGLLMNTLPVRVPVAPQAPLIPWLQALQETQVAARRYEYSSLVQVQAWSGVQPRPGDSHALFESLVVFENKAMGSTLGRDKARNPGSIEIRSSIHDGALTGYPLTLIAEPGHELLLTVAYDRRRFDAAAITRLQGHLQTILEGMMTEADQMLAELPLLTAAERQQLLVAWNDTTTAYPREQCIHELFEAQAAQTPDAVAVVFADQQLTYQELNARANQLAYHLRVLGVGPEVLVGLCVERSVEMVIGILAILKAGGAYLPLDPAYPQERLAFMLEETQTPVLLTQAHFAVQLPTRDVHILCLDTDWATIAKASTANPVNSVTADHLAYVMYTSGSTGQPKGVSVVHRSVVRLVKATNYANLGPEEVFLQFAPTSFDAATLELWGSLLNGGRLVVFPAHTPSLEELGAVLKAQGVTTLWLTAGLFHLMVDERLADLAGVRQLLAGGDVLSVPHIKKVLAELPACQLINGYGPTENTTFTCCYPVTDVTALTPSAPIGRPIANTQVYILDQAFQPTPVGIVGELYIGGDGLARGYFQRPAITAEKFVPNPFSTQPGARLYRTGDLVRCRPDGNLEFLGRIDNQVKIRGFRIELGEIESVVGQHPAVQDAVVVARRDASGEKQLVAYCVPTQGQQPTSSELQHFLQERLPDYMTPARFVLLNAFPLNPNGKVDRKALPAVEDASADGIDLDVAPRTPVEEVLAGIWANVFAVECIGAHADFFQLGGHSLRATQVISRVRETFQIDLPLRDLFEAPTLAGLAVRVEAALRARQGTAPLAPIAPAPRDQPLPLSFAQQRLWFIDQVEPGNAAYNIFYALRLSGALNVAALEASLQALVARHETLRTTFAAVDGQPHQVIAATLPVTLPVEDRSQTAPADSEGLVRKLADQEAAQPFDLARGPLFRVRLLKLGAEEHVIFLTMHHIISDEWSLSVVVRELAALYEAFRHTQESEAAALPALPIQYADFAHWQRTWLQGEVLQSQIDYWRQQLGGELSTIALPFDYPRPPAPTYAGALHTFVLPADVAAGLKALSRQAGVTLFMTVLAIFQTLLHRQSGQEEMVIGTDVANRNRLETEGLIGFFVNHLVLRTDLSGKPTFRELLARVREVTFGAYAHQDMPFDRLVSALQPERTLAHNPLFQVLFVFGNPTAATLELPGVSWRPVQSDVVLAKYDLTLFIHEGEETIRGTWRYSTERFATATIQRLSEQFCALAASIVANPDNRLHRLDLMTAAEKEEQRRERTERQQAKGRRLRTVNRKGVELTPAT